MKRIAFRISQALRRWRKRHDLRADGRFCMMGLAGDDDRPRGPGWFDSSWDLGRGLEVRLTQPGQPGFQIWLDAMSRKLPAPGAVPGTAAMDWAANAIEFVIDDAEPGADGDSGVEAVSADWLPARPATDDATPEAIAWEAPELELVPI